MIDILLVLLIFMGRIPVTPKAEPASAPQTPLQARTPQHVVILDVLRGIRGDKEFRINQQEVFRQNLPVRLAAICASRAQRVIFIHGDDQMSFRQVVEDIDISHAAGTGRIGLIAPEVSTGV